MTIFFRNIAQDIDITVTSTHTSVVETAEVTLASQEERDRIKELNKLIEDSQYEDSNEDNL